MASQADTFFADVYDLDADFFGSSVQIQRGATAETAITAICDVVEVQVFDSEGIATVVPLRTYEIDVADYTVSSTAVEPRQGDLILETVNGVAKTFEVQPMGSLPAWERLDSDNKRYLIRTKEVDG